MYRTDNMLFDIITCRNMCYWGSQGQAERVIKKKKFEHIQELIITLVRLKTGLLVRDLAYRFESSTGLVSKICIYIVGTTDVQQI
jgi:hypothetical protein